MKMHSMVLMLSELLLVGLLAAVVGGARAEESKPAAKETSAAAVAQHRVIACYFHRTNRCPTCRKISSYIEESLGEGFGREMKAGSVALQMIDFQDPKNQQYTDAYKITGPTLVIMDVRGDKVSAWKPAPKVWSLVGKKDAFLKYVQNEVRGYLESK
jgi:hypothetical protein